MYVGKSTLLDSIACRTEGTVTGSVMFNGIERSADDVKEHVGYIQQSDHFMPFLTVSVVFLEPGAS